MPSEMNCSVAIAADSKDELLEAAKQHVVEVHGHKDDQELHKLLREQIHEGTPPK